MKKKELINYQDDIQKIDFLKKYNPENPFENIKILKQKKAYI